MTRVLLREGESKVGWGFILPLGMDEEYGSHYVSGPTITKIFKILALKSNKNSKNGNKSINPRFKENWKFHENHNTTSKACLQKINQNLK